MTLAAFFLGRSSPAWASIDPLDTTFQNPGLSNTVYALAIQDDGKILAGGDFTRVRLVTRQRLARFNSDGTLDTSFVPHDFNGPAIAIAVQADGKIVIGGGRPLPDRPARIESPNSNDGYIRIFFRGPHDHGVRRILRRR